MKLRVVYHDNGTKTYYLDGKEATEAEVDRHFPKQFDATNIALVGWKPVHSDALAVHPSQIEAVRARNKRYGLDIDYLPDGRAVLDTRQKRRQLLQIEGKIDRRGGYGDDHGPSPQVVLPDSGGPALTGAELEGGVKEGLTGPDGVTKMP